MPKCNGSAYLEQCAQNGNFLAKILNDYRNRPIPRVVGLNGAQASITQGPKLLVQNGKSFLLTAVPAIAQNRHQFNPITADFVLPVGAPVNLNRVAENKDQATPEVGQGATSLLKVYDIDVPETVSSQSVNVLESIETDDSTAANPAFDNVNVQFKSRCPANSRVQGSFALFEAIDQGGSCNAYGVAKNYGITFQSEAAYTPNGNNRARTSTISGPAGTGVSITMVSVVTDLMYEILCGISEALSELFYDDFKGMLREEFYAYKEEMLKGMAFNPAMNGQFPQAQAVPQIVAPKAPLSPVRVARSGLPAKQPTYANHQYQAVREGNQVAQAVNRLQQPQQYYFMNPGYAMNGGQFAFANQVSGGPAGFISHGGF